VADTFLGTGWTFPVQTEGSGPIALAHHEECIRQAIWIILGTARGERAMRPDFGCGVHELVFAPNDATTAGLVTREVSQSLTMWEPRIDLLDVQVGPAPTGPNVLLIRIEYRVRATNNRFNLVYPFYLE
jgi:phage baseplate assembly protein W